MLMAQKQQTAGRPGDCSNPSGALGVRRGSSVVTSPSGSCRDASDQRRLSVHSLYSSPCSGLQWLQLLKKNISVENTTP